MTLAEPNNQAPVNTAPDHNGDSASMNKRNERRYDLLVSAAMIIALASLITASASVYMLINSSNRNNDHTAQIIAALKEQPISIPGSAGATNQSQGQATNSTAASANASPTTAAQGSAAAQRQAGSAAGQQRTGGGQQPASGQQNVGGSASAGGATGGGQQGGQQQAAPAAPAAEGAAAPAPANQGVVPQAVPAAAAAPIPSPDLLLQNTMAAAEPGVPGSQLATKAVDGQAAAPTLERVAEVRAKMAPPPGMEHMGDVVNFQIHDVAVTNDTATATLVIIWPAGWGEWTYPNSGYQYVDGEWKLQKSTVCNLAAAAWVDCY